VSTDLTSHARARVVGIDPVRTLRVEVVFHEVGEGQTDSIAAEMVSRAHELANLPEYECDVDVNVQLVATDDDPSAGADARAGDVGAR